jgi:hypothetical protein
MPAVRQYGAAPVVEHVLLSDVAQVLIDRSSGRIRELIDEGGTPTLTWGVDGPDPTTGDREALLMA